MTNLSGKEIDILLHLELQKSSKLCEDIDKELQDIISVVDNYEIYKAKGSEKRSYRPNEFLHHPSGKHLQNDKINERRSSIKQNQSQTPVVITNYMTTSSLLNKLRKMDL